MNEWSVVTVIVALLGLLATVVKPLLTLNTSIVKLTAQMESLCRDMAEFATSNTENHRRIWNRIDDHKDVLDDHGRRIDHLEHMEQRKGL